MTLASTPSLASSDAPDLDLSVLDRMVGNDPARFRKFALLFLQSVGDVMDQVDQALLAEDLAALGALGHRAKSTSMNVGAATLARQCGALEFAAQQQDRVGAYAIARGLRPLLEVVRTAIEQRLADPAAGRAA